MSNLQLAYSVAGLDTVTAEIYDSDGSLIIADIPMSDSVRPRMYLGNYAQLAAGHNIVYKDGDDVIGNETYKPDVNLGGLDTASIIRLLEADVTVSDTGTGFQKIWTDKDTGEVLLTKDVNNEDGNKVTTKWDVAMSLTKP